MKRENSYYLTREAIFLTNYVFGDKVLLTITVEACTNVQKNTESENLPTNCTEA